MKRSLAKNIKELNRCLNQIEDETEIRPGELTIRGTDGGHVDVEIIVQAVQAARHKLQLIEKAVQ